MTADPERWPWGVPKSYCYLCGELLAPGAAVGQVCKRHMRHTSGASEEDVILDSPRHTPRQLRGRP